MSQYKCVTELEKWFDSYLNFEKTPKKDIFWLDTVDFFCKKLGNPEKNSPCIHVAGSKGKGSVSAMIGSILDEAGYKIGLYSSPHILDFIERIKSAKSFFDENAYFKAATQLKECVLSTPIETLPAQRPITWFELVTLYAFLVFKNAKTDFNIFEVGLGGRLDATNIVTPKICVLTPIELEHTQFLGNTLRKIASEKAGIIKNCIPVISASQKEDVETVFRKKAVSTNSKIFFIQELILNSIQNNTYSIKKDTTLDKLYVKYNIEFSSNLFSRPIKTSLNLLGQVQLQNAQLASCAVKLALPEIDETTIEKGLSKAFLPARFEILSTNLVVDGAHTVNSINFTIKTFNEIFTTQKANLLFACAADKDVNDIAALFRERFEKITLTKPGSIKQSNMQLLTEAFEKERIDFTLEENYGKAIRESIEKALKENAVLLVTGSFYLVAEVKKILKSYNT